MTHEQGTWLLQTLDRLAAAAERIADALDRAEPPPRCADCGATWHDTCEVSA